MNRCFGVGQCALLLESACSSWGTCLFMNLWFMWLTLFLELFQVGFSAKELAPEVQTHLPKSLERDSPYLTHPVFNMWVVLRLLHWEVTKPELLRHNVAFLMCWLV
jgi:hypothetical protein